MRYKSVSVTLLLFFTLFIQMEVANAMSTSSLNDIPNDVIEHNILPHILNKGPWPRAEYGGRPFYNKNRDKEDDIKTIRALAHANKKFWKIINSEQVTGYFIDILAERYEEDKLVLARHLRTPGAGQWIKRLYPVIYKRDLSEHLINAAEYKQKGIALFLLNYCPQIVDYTRMHPFDRENSSALYYAASAGQEKIVNALIQAGADVNRRGQNGDTPLHGATSNAKPYIVKRLLDSKANPSLRNFDNFTPLANAIRLRNWLKGSDYRENDRKKLEEIITILRSRMGWMRWMWSYIAGE